MFLEAGRGIRLSNQNEEELATRLINYSPYIIFRVKPLLSLIQAMRAIRKAGGTRKK